MTDNKNQTPEKKATPFFRSYEDRKIMDLQEGFAATNQLADLQMARPETEPPTVCDDGETPLTDDLFQPAEYDAANPRSYILPVISLAIGNIAYYAMWLRRYMVDEANKDYIRLARAKGMTSGQVAFRHIFRNALVPMVQSLPASLLFTISGSLYVESLFSINGMGGLLITSIQRQDNPLVQAMVLLYSVISVLGLLLGDLAMMLVDPRITFTKKGGSR